MSTGPLQDATELREALGELIDAARAVRANWERGDLAAAVRQLVDLAEDTAEAYTIDPTPIDSPEPPACPVAHYEPTPLADELQETRDALRQLVEEIRTICRTPYPTADSGLICRAVVTLRDQAEAVALRHELDADAYPAEAPTLAERWSHAAALERD